MNKDCNASYLPPIIDMEIMVLEQGVFSSGNKDTNPDPTENPDLGDGSDTDW